MCVLGSSGRPEGYSNRFDVRKKQENHKIDFCVFCCPQQAVVSEQ